MPYKINPHRTWTLEETKIPQRAWTLEETQIPHRPNSKRRAPRRDIRGAVVVNPSFSRFNEPVLEEDMEPQLMEAPRVPSGHQVVAIKRENINVVRECELRDVQSHDDNDGGTLKTTLSKPLAAIFIFVCLTSFASLFLTLLMVSGTVRTKHSSCGSMEVAGSTGRMQAVDESIVDVSENITSLDKKLEERIRSMEKRHELKVQELFEELRQLKLTLQQQKTDSEEKVISQEKQLQNLTYRLGSTQFELESLKAQLFWQANELWNTTNSTRAQVNQLETVWFSVNATSERISNLTSKTDYRFDQVWQNMNASNGTLNKLVISLKLKVRNESETVWFSLNQSRKGIVLLKSSLQSLRENMTNLSQSLETRIEREEQKSNYTSQLTQQHLTKLQDLEKLLNFTRQAAKETSRQQLTALWSTGNNTKKEIFKVWSSLNGSQIQLEEKLMKVKHNLTEQLRHTKVVLESSDASLFASLTNVNASLAEKIKNVSKMAGPIGPPGFNGSRGLTGPAGSTGAPGPKGAGDFSKCHYNFLEINPIKGSIHSQASISEADGEKILGATCLSNYAKKHYLTSSEDKNNLKRKYICNCYGDSETSWSLDRKKCSLHYWECPLTT